MLRSYEDIKSKIDEQPKWYDDNGVPRYCEFHPNQMGIYEDLVISALIACQSCGQQFHVANGSNHHERYKAYILAGRPIDNNVLSLNSVEAAQSFHYGDPPNHDCVGDTMNCKDLQVIEVWARHIDNKHEWHRVPEAE